MCSSRPSFTIAPAARGALHSTGSGDRTGRAVGAGDTLRVLWHKSFGANGCVGVQVPPPPLPLTRPAAKNNVGSAPLINSQGLRAAARLMSLELEMSVATTERV